MTDMAKYDPLANHLERTGLARVAMSFDEIDVLVGGLPKSAREHQAWWQGESAESPTHVQKRAWGAAGFRVASLDLGGRRVVFRKR